MPPPRTWSGPSGNRTVPVLGASIGVTGLTAVNIDVSTKLGSALLPYLAIVVGPAFMLLMLVFRSPIFSFLPILLVGMVFGLAMDYEVFPVTRLREEFVHSAEPRDAVVRRFGHGARWLDAGTYFSNY